MDCEVIKSPNDSNLYRALTLDNGLQVLLISNQNKTDEDDCPKVDKRSNSANQPLHNEQNTEETESGDEEMSIEENDPPEDEEEKSTKKTNLAAAALCVRVGGFSDPEDMPGLAHFLEHMLFMGSQKYPEENAYDSFITSHGGSDNAYTDCEHTVYAMDVVPQHFKEALMIFANCFIAPLLRHEIMDREVEAVDSEFSLIMASDGERESYLLQSTAIKGHPMSKFICGNRKTLKDDPAENGVDVNKALNHFYKTYYSSEHMTLAVQSTETLETLEEWVRETFTPIPNLNLPAPRFRNLLDPFDMEKFHKFYKIVPVKDKHQIRLSWALPPLREHYRSKPVRFLGGLIGHEGKGSILSFLRKKFWAIALMAGSSENGVDMNDTCSFFAICITLTELGMDNLFEVITAVFQYLMMLRTEGLERYIFDELQAIANKGFQFQEQAEPFEYVERLAANMQLYPCKDYLTGDKLYFEYDEKLITDCINELVFSKVNVIVLSSRYTRGSPGTKVEPLTQCNYTIEEFPESWAAKWNSVLPNPDFHLPDPNKFLATDFALKHTTSTNEHPYKILKDGQGCLWFKEDTKFKVPKAHLYYHFISPVAFSSAVNNAMTDLFVKIFVQLACEDTYPAEISYLNYYIMSSFEGFLLQCWGFNHKLPLLLGIILDKMSKFEVGEELFETMKKQLRLAYYNSSLKPRELSKIVQYSFVMNVFWTPLEKRKELQYVTLEMFLNYVQTLLSQVYLECLVQGNITSEEALHMYSMVIKRLDLKPLHPDNLPSLQCFEMPRGETVCRVASFNKENANSVITSYFQFGLRDLELQTNTELLSEFMYEPCFDKLRTREQLGYQVACMKRVIWNCVGFSVEVNSQSSKYSCSYVDERIEAFLNTFLEEIQDMSEKKYQTHLDSLIECKKQVILSLKEETDLNWRAVTDHTYVFDKKQRQIDYLEKLKSKDFKEWVREVLPSNLKERRKLSIQVAGPNDEALDGALLEEEITLIAEELAEAEREYRESNEAAADLNYLPRSTEKPTAHYVYDIKRFTAKLSSYPKVSTINLT